jgi:hypothetical protein
MNRINPFSLQTTGLPPQTATAGQPPAAAMAAPAIAGFAMPVNVLFVAPPTPPAARPIAMPAAPARPRIQHAFGNPALAQGHHVRRLVFNNTRNEALTPTRPGGQEAEQGGNNHAPHVYLDNSLKRRLTYPE